MFVCMYVFMLLGEGSMYICECELVPVESRRFRRFQIPLEQDLPGSGELADLGDGNQTEVLWKSAHTLNCCAIFPAPVFVEFLIP